LGQAGGLTVWRLSTALSGVSVTGYRRWRPSPVAQSPRGEPTVSIHRRTETVVLPTGLVEYRWEPRGPQTVLILHGGHMRAELALGEDVYADAGYSVLVPSRPGYGRTPLCVGATASAFVDVLPWLCHHLGVTEVAAAVGISGGGRTAVTLAAKHPALVQRMILQSAVSFLPWPDRWTRIGAQLVFAASTERRTWAAIAALLHRHPQVGLRMLLAGLSVLPAAEVVARLRPCDRTELLDLFSRMRSGHGFLNDLRDPCDPIPTAHQPTLVIATRNDRAVPFAHARALVRVLPRGKLIDSTADTHFIWFGDDRRIVDDEIRAFLASPCQPDRPT
jgi:pimeloyl-ACP methyl ester carboxylesterase